MSFIADIVHYMIENSSKLLHLTLEHILMVGYGMILALLVGVTLGIIAAKYEKLAPIIISITNVIQLIPSLAMLAILMLYMGFGYNTVIIGLFFYSLLPIVKNTYVGLKEVDNSIVEAGVGSGMKPFQLLAKIQFPLTLPYLMAGLRLATVIAISVTTIGPYVGAGGLGTVIVSGISTQSDVKIYAGSIIAAVIAIVLDFILGKVENVMKKKTA